MPTPYAGLFTGADGVEYAPRTGAHVLVSCPTGGGKTESVLAPAVICHPGPVIAVSSKDDLLHLASERRGTGPRYLIDLRQIETPYYGEDMIACRIDPTMLVDTHDDALNVATWLHRAASLSLGGKVTSNDEPYWAAQIIPSLAALLYAASPRGNGLGIDWALHAVENPFPPQDKESAAAAIPSIKVEQAEMAAAAARYTEIRDDAAIPESEKLEAEAAMYRSELVYETAKAAQAAAVAAAAAAAESSSGLTPEELRAQRIAAGEDPNKVFADMPPSWFDVRQYFADLPFSLLPTKIERVGGTLAPRQRDSVALGMSAALMPWLYESVRRRELLVFDPVMLNEPGATLFILAEPEGGGVPAALPLVQAVVSAWRARTSAGTLAHNLMVAIDELTNTMPLPTLDVLVSEARGLGLNLLVAVQAAQQIAHRYDPVFEETLLNIFPVMLVMHGSAELDILEQAALWSGPTTRAREQLDQTTGNRHLSLDEDALHSAFELQPRQPYRGRLVFRGTAGIDVRLPSFPEFLHMFDNRTVEGLERI